MPMQLVCRGISHEAVLDKKRKISREEITRNAQLRGWEAPDLSGEDVTSLWRF
jgi:hypothetical protein